MIDAAFGIAVDAVIVVGVLVVTAYLCWVIDDVGRTGQLGIWIRTRGRLSSPPLPFGWRPRRWWYPRPPWTEDDL